MWKVTASSWVIASTSSEPLRSVSLNSSSISILPVLRHGSAGCSTGISISCAPIASISSRMMPTTRWCTRQPAGIHVHMPAPICLTRPALTISLWETASASAGACFSVGSRYSERRGMGVEGIRPRSAASDG
jgi:hypothetical protein